MRTLRNGGAGNRKRIAELWRLTPRSFQDAQRIHGVVEGDSLALGISPSSETRTPMASCAAFTRSLNLLRSSSRSAARYSSRQ